MSKKKKYAHIVQDACGLLKIDESNQWVGLFTDDVESCSIYVFESGNSVVMCHDSGQMKIESIAEVVSKAGNVEHVQILKYAENNFDNDRWHARRREELLRQLKLTSRNVDEILCPWRSFTAIYDIEKRLRAVENRLPIGAESPPDIAYRRAVAKLNNAFIPKNSQILPSNLQFDGDQYLPALEPVKNLQKILEMVEEQPRYLFMNLAVLLGADCVGAVKLPEPVRAFARDYRITPREFPNDNDQQELAFKLFRAKKFSNMVSR